MKVLSVRQPWAWALIHGGKDVENRNWFTQYRGLLAIHAGKSFDMTQEEFAGMCRGEYGEPFTSMALGYSAAHNRIGDDDPRGAIIGIVELYDCIPDSRCTSPWRADGYEFFCWMVRNPVALLEPIPMKGRLGLWDIPDSLIEGADRG